MKNKVIFTLLSLCSVGAACAAEGEQKNSKTAGSLKSVPENSSASADGIDVYAVALAVASASNVTDSTPALSNNRRTDSHFVKKGDLYRSITGSYEIALAKHDLMVKYKAQRNKSRSFASRARLKALKPKKSIEKKVVVLPKKEKKADMWPPFDPSRLIL